MGIVDVVTVGFVALALIAGLLVVALRSRAAAKKSVELAQLREIAWPAVQLAPEGPVTLRGAAAIGDRWMQVEVSAPPGHPMRLWLRVPVEVRGPAPDPYRELAPKDAPYRQGAVDRSAVKGPLGASFRLVTRADWLARSLRLCRAAGTGDAELDAKVMVESAAPRETLAAMLQDPGVRAAILRVLGAGVERIDVLLGRPEIVAVRRNPTAEQAAQIGELGRDLGVLAAGLPAVRGEAIERRPAFVGMRLPLWIVGVSGGLLALAVLGYERYLIADEAALPALVRAGALAWLPVCFGAYWLFRGRTRGLGGFAFALPALLAGTIGAAVNGGAYLNQAADSGPEAVFDVEVLGSSVSMSESSRGDTSKTYHATFASWRDPGREVHLEVSAKDFQLLQRARWVELVTRPGAFGWEWVKEIRPVRETQGSGEKK